MGENILGIFNLFATWLMFIGSMLVVYAIVAFVLFSLAFGIASVFGRKKW